MQRTYSVSLGFRTRKTPAFKPLQIAAGDKLGVPSRRAAACLGTSVREEIRMGKHSVPKGEYSTKQQNGAGGKPNGSPQTDPKHKPKHSK